MNVLMVSDVYFPRVNGVSTSIETFRTRLQRNGHRVSLIAPSYGEADEIENSTDTLRIRSRKVPFDPEDRYMSYREIAGMVPELRRQSFDLVHIQTPFVAHYAGVRLARELGLPCVATYHTFFEEYLFHYVRFMPREWLRGAARRFSRLQCADYTALLVPSSAMRDQLAGYGVTTPMTVLPTGIPLERFTAGDGADFRRRYGIAAQRKVALFVGRVAHEKNIDFLLEVAAHVRIAVPDFLLLVAGEGPAREAIARHSEELGLSTHVKFVGYLDRHHELANCYAAADAFVFASRTETQGLVLLEAMAMGIPVVGLAVMGTRDILLPQRGALVAEDDVDDFARQVIRLMEDPPLRRDLALDARKYAAEWSAERLAGRLEDFYRDIVSSNRRATPTLEPARAS